MIARVAAVACMVALAACGLYFSDDQGPVDAPLFFGDDERPPPPPPVDACDPLAPPGQQGCGAGQKCTWIEVQETPVPIGKLGCVPDGSVPLGGACLKGPPGETTGFDDCQVGGVCAGGVCEDICGFEAGPGAACPGGYLCTPRSGLFRDGEGETRFGVCAPSCDPLTQATPDGGTCAAGQGCYVLTSASTTIAVCARAGTVGHGQPLAGPVFANSCLPGHRPRHPANGDPSWECGALCRPADVTVTTHVADEGGVAPFTCASQGAAPPDSPTAGESCRYFWALEQQAGPSVYSNTLGFCLKHAVWRYDSDGDLVADALIPRCTTLTHGDVVPPIADPPHDDARFFWCVSRPAALTGAGFDRPRGPDPGGYLDRIEDRR